MLTSMADLRLHPHINQGRLEDAFKDIRNNYKGLGNIVGDTPVRLSQGNPRGPGFAETMLPGEIGPDGNAKNPDALRVELRKGRGFAPQKMRSLLLGELMHQVGETKQGIALKKKLIASLTPDQLAQEKRIYERFKAQGEGGTNFATFENALMTSQGDALVRGGLLPELMVDPREQEFFSRPAEEGGMFTKEQRGILAEYLQLIQ